MKESWEGIVYSSSLGEDEKSDCKLEISGDKIIATTPDNQKFELNLREVRCKLGGIGNRLIFIEPKDKEEPVFSTSDTSILDALMFTGFVEIDKEVEKVKKSIANWRAWLIWSVGAIILIIGLTLGFFYVYGASFILKFIPPSVDRNVGAVLYKEYMLTKHVIKNNILDTELNKITSVLSKNLVSIIPFSKNFDFKVVVIDSSKYKVKHFLNGNIVISKAVIKRMDTEDELAGIIAREMVFISNRYKIKKIIKVNGTIFIASMFFKVIFGTSFKNFQKMVLANSKLFLNLKFSDKVEEEVDFYSLKLLKASNFDTNALYKYFKKLKDEYNKFLENLKKSAKTKVDGLIKKGLVKVLQSLPMTAFLDERLRNLKSLQERIGTIKDIKKFNVKKLSKKIVDFDKIKKSLFNTFDKEIESGK